MSTFTPKLTYPPGVKVILSDSSNKTGGTQDFVVTAANTNLTLRSGFLPAYSLRDSGAIKFYITGQLNQTVTINLACRLVIDGTPVGFNTAIATPNVTQGGTGYFFVEGTLTPIAAEDGTQQQLFVWSLDMTDNTGAPLAGGTGLRSTQLLTIDPTADHTITMLMRKSDAITTLDIRSYSMFLFGGSTVLS